MRILLASGVGFLGRHLCGSLLEALDAPVEKIIILSSSAVYGASPEYL